MAEKVGALNPAKKAALGFVRKYAWRTPFFDAGQALQAYRETKDPHARLNWSRNWWYILKLAADQRWISKHDLAKSEAKHSHRKHVIVWKSLVYQGGLDAKSSMYHGDLQGAEQGVKSTLESIKKRVYDRSLTLDKALWQAYVCGVEKQYKMRVVPSSVSD